MDYAWTVYLRDIFVILAAAAVVLASLYAALVAWNIYRFAQSLSVEVRPILASVQQSAETVEHTTDFLAGRALSPASAASNGFLGLWGLFQLYRQARRAAGPEAPAAELEAPVARNGAS